MSELINRELLLRAFRRLGDELGNDRVRAELVLAGGAVIALLFDTERVTRDDDGRILSGHGPLTKAARRIAGELGLPRGWLNEGVAMYLSTKADPDRTVVFDHANLIIYATSSEQMLALKARAARAQDIGDLRLLAAALDIDTAAKVIAVVDRFFPNDPLNPKSLAVIEDLFD